MRGIINCTISKHFWRGKYLHLTHCLLEPGGSCLKHMGMREFSCQRFKRKVHQLLHEFDHIMIAKSALLYVQHIYFISHAIIFNEIYQF